MAIINTSLVTTNVFQDGIVDKTTGEALSGGIVTLYKDNNRTEFKNWYYQSGTAGNYTFIPLANPLTLSAAGTVQDPEGNDVLPFFYPYSEDSQTTREAYYITVYSAANVLQFTRENFPFSGAQSTVNEEPTLDNLIINNRFWRNTGTDAPTSQNENTSTLTDKTNIVLAPSAHDGFSQPDFRFIKSATGAVETMTFKKFALDDPLLENDITPEFYVLHNCTTPGSEANKFYQFPISLHLRTLESQSVTFTIQAKNNSGNPNNQIQISIAKFTGSTASGGTFIESSLGSITLTNAWIKHPLRGTIPAAGSDPLSSAGDDAYYLRIKLPASQKTCNVSFAVPSLFFGNTAPTDDFKTYDQIDSVICTPRTGDYKQSLNAVQIAGYVPCNDGTIGSRTSGATRANIDCWPLYNLIWNKVGRNFAPITGTSTGTAFGDWDSNFPLSLTKNLGRVLMGMLPDVSTPTNTPFASTTFTVTVTPVDIDSVDTSTDEITLTTSTAFVTGDPIQLSTAGTLPDYLDITSTYYVIAVSGTVIKLSYTLSDALAGIYIDLNTAGTGTSTIVNTVYDFTVSSQKYIIGTPVQVSNSGGALPTGLSANTVYYISGSGITPGSATTTIRLADNITDAQNNRYITFSTAGSGTNTISNVLGATTGVGFNDQIIQHDHEYTIFNYTPEHKQEFSGGAESPVSMSSPTVNTRPTGQVSRNSNITPATMVNVFLKL